MMAPSVALRGECQRDGGAGEQAAQLAMRFSDPPKIAYCSWERCCSFGLLGNPVSGMLLGRTWHCIKIASVWELCR